MHYIANFLTPPYKKGGGYDMEDWNVHVKEFSEGEILVASKDGLPSSVWGEMEDNYKEYFSFTHK